MQHTYREVRLKGLQVMGTDFWIEFTSDKPLEKHLDMKP